MSKFQERLNTLCPEGVPFKKLSDVCDNIFAGGTPNTANSDYYDGDIPWIRSGEVDFNFIRSAERNITQAGYDNSSAKWIRKNSVVMAMTGATVAKSAVVEFATTANQSVAALEPSEEIDYKFLYYYISSQYERIKGMAQGALTSINLQIIKDIVVPVPPLEVQRKIVEVLDNFSELTAELTARQKQYEYYRDNLLSFNNINWGGQSEVKWMKLRDICSKVDNIKWKYTNNSYQYIDLTSVDIQTHSIFNTTGVDGSSAPSRAQQIVKKDDVIFATTRPTQMRVCLIPIEYDGQICSTGFCVLRPIQTIVLPQYLFFTLAVERFKEFLSNNQTMGNYPSISNNLLKEYMIPIPPIDKQEMIIEILDRFETLTTDLVQGLPAEIKARQQQYEYYRDKLLTFRRKAC